MILIVDDTPANIEVLMGSLGSGKYKIATAVNGKAGVEMAKKINPDLILLDVMMPVMDGYAACETLKKNELTKNIPVIFLTAKIQPEDISKGFEMGAVDYLVKPFNEPELFARIENHLELQEKRKQLHKERNELHRKNQIIENDLKLARKIQNMAMPSNPPNSGVAFHYCSMDLVGGDFYTFFELSADKLGVFISDVSGHGVAAAFITLLIKNTLEHNRDHLLNPEKLMGCLNESLYGQTADNFFTAIYAIIDYENSKIEYVSAGHNQPYLIAEEIELLDSERNSPPMGILTNDQLKKMNKFYTLQKANLTKGNKVLFYTDGLTEAIRKSERNDPGAKDFETVMLKSALKETQNNDCKSIVETLMEKLKTFCETDNFEDDVCIICVSI